MGKFVDDEDELQDVKASKAEATPAKTTRASVVDDDEESGSSSKETSKKAAAVADDIEWGDEKAVGKGDGLERLRPEKGRVVRFAILPFVKPKKANVHYVEKKGTYRCLSQPGDDEPASCCKKLGDSTTRVVALVCYYTNVDQKTGKQVKDSNGNPRPLEYEIRYVQLSRGNYWDISALPEEDQTVYDIDIVMGTKNNGIGYTFNKIASKALWKKNPDLAKEVETACKPFLDGKKLTNKLGKVVNALELKAVLAAAAAGADEASMDDVENL